MLFPTVSGGLFGLFDDGPRFLIIDSDLNLTDLGDVNINSVLNNQIIIFNSATLQWENKNQPAASGSRTYTSISPIVVDNDFNIISLNVLPDSDWNGLFDGNDSTFYIDWTNSVNRNFSLLSLDDNSSFDGRYLQESDGNVLYVKLNPTAGQVISDVFDLNHLAGHTYLGHTVLIGDEDDELLLLQANSTQTEHIFSVTDSQGNHIFTIAGDGETDLNLVASEDDAHALHIDVDANGFANIVGLEFDFVTGPLGQEEEVQVILIAVDQFEADFGQVDGIQMVATQGDANLHFAEIGILIDPITQLSGIFGDMDSAFVAGVDRLSEFTSFDSNIAMFVNDDDNVLIGNSEQFAEIEFLLQTTSSGAGIKPVFEHSTGVGTFSAFTPTDTTEGMRSNGVIAFDLELIPDWEVGANSEFLIRITRTRNSLTTVPIEGLVQIAVAEEFFWNAAGSIFVNDLNASLIEAITINVADLNATNNVSGLFAGGNIDVNSQTGHVTIDFDDGNFLSFVHTWTDDQTITDNDGWIFGTTSDVIIQYVSVQEIWGFDADNGGAEGILTKFTLDSSTTDNVAAGGFLVAGSTASGANANGSTVTLNTGAGAGTGSSDGGLFSVATGGSTNGASGSVLFNIPDGGGSNGTYDFQSGGDSAISISSTIVVVNDAGLDVDFRVEGDLNSNLIRADASTDFVGIGIAPTSKLHVAGDVKIGEGAAGRDYCVDFDGETNDGQYCWMEDEDQFEFADDVLMNGAEKTIFRDASHFIHSPEANRLKLSAGSNIQFYTPLVEATITANNITFNNGTTDTGLRWDSEGTMKFLVGSSIRASLSDPSFNITSKLFPNGGSQHNDNVDANFGENGQAMFEYDKTPDIFLLRLTGAANFFQIDGDLNVQDEASGFFDGFGASLKQASTDFNMFFNEREMNPAKMGFVALCDGSIVGIGTTVNVSVSAASATWEMTIRVENTDQTSLSINASSTGFQSAFTTIGRGERTFNAGDILTLYVKETGANGSTISPVMMNARLQYNC